MAKRKKRTSRRRRKTSSRNAKAVNVRSLFPTHRKQQHFHSTAQRNDTLLRELRHAYLHDGLALYVGFGVSRSMGMPNWAELIRSLAARMMMRRVTTAADQFDDLDEEKKWKAIRNT